MEIDYKEIAIYAVIFLIVLVAAQHLSVVVSGSMEPAFYRGDIVLTEKSDFLGYLNRGLTIGEDGADTIGSLIGQSDFSSVLSDLARQLRDSNGDITEPSLLGYLKNSLGLPIPNQPIPPVPPIP